MKDKLLAGFLFAVVCLTLASTAMGTTTWYVNGVTGNDHHSCTSPSTACKTISHAITLAASGDAINVAPAIYRENLTIGSSMKILGSGANTTIVDGGGVASVVSISHGIVTLSGMRFRNGRADRGAGITNSGTLTLSNIIVSGNAVKGASGEGAGIVNGGTLTLSNSIVSGNALNISCPGTCVAQGGGIYNSGGLFINNSTVSGNAVVLLKSCTEGFCFIGGGGIFNSTLGTVTVRNSTISGNKALVGGAIENFGHGNPITIINSTVSGNSSPNGGVIFIWGGTVSISNGTISRNYGGGVRIFSSGAATLQNSIVANNSGANCLGVTSKGYNLSSDGSCAFNGPGDLNNTDPVLGPLQNNGGPTKTMALLPGSPAVDAGNPSGCTDGSGHLLKTDQRGQPRPDPDDTGGCDMGAYERRSD